MAKDPDRTMNIIPPIACIPYENVRAYFIADETFSSILNPDLRMINGVYLDSASASEMDIESKLDTILYE